MAAHFASSRPQVGTARPFSSGPSRTGAEIEPPAVVVSSSTSSCVHPAAFFCRLLLQPPVVPLDAIQDVVCQAFMSTTCLLWTPVDLVRSVQGRSAGTRLGGFLLLGIGVLGVRQVPQEVHRLERCRVAAAGCRAPQLLPGCLDLQVSSYINSPVICL